MHRLISLDRAAILFNQSINPSSNICDNAYDAICGNLTGDYGGFVYEGIEANNLLVKKALLSPDVISEFDLQMNATDLKRLGKAFYQICRQTDFDSSDSLTRNISFQEVSYLGLILNETSNLKSTFEHHPSSIAEIFPKIESILSSLGSPMLSIDISGDVLGFKTMIPHISINPFSVISGSDLKEWTSDNKEKFMNIVRLLGINLTETFEQISDIVTMYEAIIMTAAQYTPPEESNFEGSKEDLSKFVALLLDGMASGNRSLLNNHIDTILQRNSNNKNNLVSSSPADGDADDEALLRSYIPNSNVRKGPSIPTALKKAVNPNSLNELIMKSNAANTPLPPAPISDEDKEQMLLAMRYVPTRDALVNGSHAALLGFDLGLNAILESLGAESGEDMLSKVQKGEIKLEQTISYISQHVFSLSLLFSKLIEHGVSETQAARELQLYALARVVVVLMESHLGEGFKLPNPQHIPLVIDESKCIFENAARLSSTVQGNSVPDFLTQLLDFTVVDELRSESSNRKKLAHDLSVEIIEQFKQRISELEWPSNEMKRLVIQKAEQVKIKTSHPDYMDSPHQFEEHVLKSVEDLGTILQYAVHDSKYFDLSLKSILESITIQILQKSKSSNLRQWTNSDVNQHFLSPATTFNAWYNPERNDITMPFAIITEPLAYPYDPAKVTDKEMATALTLTYGGIGQIIGHELTHGFDNKGAEFDGEGTHREWRPEEDKKNFISMTECLVEQYNRLPNVGPPLSPHLGNLQDGQLKLGENMADAGGHRLAFRALQARLQRDPRTRRFFDNDFSDVSDPSGPHAGKVLNVREPQLLRGIHANTPRLFHLQSGRVWCQRLNSEEYDTISGDVHAPGFTRLLNFFRNGEFSREIFGCEKKHTVRGQKNEKAAFFSGTYEKKQSFSERLNGIDTAQCIIW